MLERNHVPTESEIENFNMAYSILCELLQNLTSLILFMMIVFLMSFIACVPRIELTLNALKRNVKLMNHHIGLITAHTDANERSRRAIKAVKHVRMLIRQLVSLRACMLDNRGRLDIIDNVLTVVLRVCSVCRSYIL
jgi:flagellar biosynthesis regulator FlaF